jgi:hypothetical protein
MEKTFFEYFTAETRLFVLECSVFIEEKISDTLGKLLGIVDLEKSKSLGSSSSCLSFFQKKNLILDIISNLEEQDKFTQFMEIRNKFAHVKKVNSFERLFELSNDFKKKLDKWYEGKAGVIEDTEIKYKTYFQHLTFDISHILFEIDVKHIIKSTKKKVEEEIREELIQILRSELSSTEEGNELWLKIIDQLKENQSNKKSK